MDSDLQEAPYDVFRADEALSQQELTTMLGASSMWTAAHAYPLLPYSCVIMESTVLSVPQRKISQAETDVAEVSAAGSGKKKVIKQKVSASSNGSPSAPAKPRTK